MNIIKALKIALYVLLPVGLVLATLKLAGFINWSWSLVCLPFWAPMTTLFFAVMVALALVKMKLLHIDIDGDGDFGETESHIKFLHINAKGCVWFGKEKNNE